MDMSDDLIEKSPSPSRRIEDLDAVRLDYLCFTFSFFIVLLDLSLDLYLARISESFCESEM